MSFDNLGLRADLLRAVRDEGYQEPTPIQSVAIPAILEGRDIMARAQTGTGKTAGFTLPLLHRLMESRSGTSHQRRLPVRALILAPTRELAAQVRASVATYGRHLPLRSAVVYGGIGFGPQVQALRRGVDVLVATPGRLLDHVRQGTVDLSRVETLVLDEADRMLDMGFIHDIRKILEELPETRQNLLFSATLSAEIRKLADGLLNSPSRIEVPSTQPAAEAVEQLVHPVDRERKSALLSYLIGSQRWTQTLVFTRTRRGADRLTRNLQRDGIRAVAIHGDKTQGARTRALEDFRRGRVPVLVATDIAARGLDIDQLPHVVNFELPHVAEDYVHRIGRTGRAGNAGNAVSLVSPEEQKLLWGIERLLKRDVASAVVPGFEPSKGSGRERDRDRDRDRDRRPMTARPRGRSNARFGRDQTQNRQNRRRRRPRSA